MSLNSLPNVPKVDLCGKRHPSGIVNDRERVGEIPLFLFTLLVVADDRT